MEKVIYMTEMKRECLLEEVKEYLIYDNILSEIQKVDLINNIEEEKQITGEWEKIIFDYFYCHTVDDGSILSLENFFLQKELNKEDKEYYKQINEKFTDVLFKNNKPLFFFDVDNTLTDFAFLSDEKKQYIGSFDEKERIILSTGKVYQSILNVIDDCKLNESYSSCLNGSVVIYNNQFESISKIGNISEEISKKIEKEKINYILYYNNIIHVRYPLSSENIFNLKKYNEWYIDEEMPTRFDEIIKVLCFINEGEEEKEDRIRNIVKDYPHLVCVRTAGHTFEILKKDQHKGNTVKLISKRLGRYYRCSVGAGDSMNDLPMLNYVGRPYIVSTSNEELKSYGFEVLEKNRNIDIVNLIKKYK